MEENIDVPVLTDCDDETFQSFIKECKSLGLLYSCRGLLVATFEQLHTVKDEYVRRAKEMQVDETKQSEYNAIVTELKDKVYPMLQRIESRYYAISNEIQSKTPDTSKSGS